VERINLETNGKNIPGRHSVGTENSGYVQKITDHTVIINTAHQLLHCSHIQRWLKWKVTSTSYVRKSSALVGSISKEKQSDGFKQRSDRTWLLCGEQTGRRQGKRQGS
jgi:hypothetical protein